MHSWDSQKFIGAKVPIAPMLTGSLKKIFEIDKKYDYGEKYESFLELVSFCDKYKSYFQFINFLN